MLKLTCIISPSCVYFLRNIIILFYHFFYEIIRRTYVFGEGKWILHLKINKRRLFVCDVYYNEKKKKIGRKKMYMTKMKIPLSTIFSFLHPLHLSLYPCMCINIVVSLHLSWFLVYDSRKLRFHSTYVCEAIFGVTLFSLTTVRVYVGNWGKKKKNKEKKCNSFPCSINSKISLKRN